MLALEWNMDDALQARFEDGYEDGHNHAIESVAFNLINMGMTVELRRYKKLQSFLVSVSRNLHRDSKIKL